KVRMPQEVEILVSASYLHRIRLMLTVGNPIIPDFNLDMVHCGQNVTIHPSANIMAPVLIAHGCRIIQGVSIKGPVVIGTDNYIEEGVCIESSVLWNNIHVGANARLSQFIIGSNTSIESNSQITSSVVTTSQTKSLS
ncbi:hypothetical protein ACFLV0_05835, partial [Chloroflexota bacterium]